MKRLFFLFFVVGTFCAQSQACEIISIILQEPNPYKGVDENLNDWSTWDIIACALTLPVCALDEKSDKLNGATQISRKTLEANDYSKNAIDQIMASQNKLAELLNEKKLQLKIEKSDSSDSVLKELNKFGAQYGMEFPADYAKFLVDYL